VLSRYIISRDEQYVCKIRTEFHLLTSVASENTRSSGGPETDIIITSDKSANSKDKQYEVSDGTSAQCRPFSAINY